MLQSRTAAVAVLATAAVAYTLLSVVNHLCFRTFGLDLGLYTHALYNYSHLQADDCTFFLPEARNLLSDHFDLYLVLFSPLVWLFGSYTLLIVQIVAVLFGTWGVYRLIGEYSHALRLPAMIAFLSFFGIWHALSFDYHSNVVAAMWVPWLLYWLRRGRYGLFCMAVVIVCIGKESMPLWLSFVLAALLIDYRHDRKAMAWIGGAIVFCVTYLLVVTQVVMPALCPEPAQGFGRYHYMGDNFGAVALWIASHPWETLKNLFVNFSGNPANEGLKAEFYFCLLISGGILCTVRPQWLLPLVPLVAQKMLADDITLWGITYQYNVEFAVVVIPIAFIVIAGWKAWWLRLAAAVLVPLMCIGITLYTVSLNPHLKTWVRSENVRLHDSRHYHQATFSTRYARQLMAQIPTDASVCASSCFTPHLALRDEIYLYPNGLNYTPEYLLVTADDNPSDTLLWQLMESDGASYLYTLKTEYKQ